MHVNILPKNFENELYSDTVEIFQSRKPNVGKPNSTWLGLEW